MFTVKQIKDIYDVRRQLESSAAVMAARKLKPENFSRLHSLLEDMKLAGEVGDFLRLSKADLAFHQLVWKCSGNEALDKALNSITTPLFAFYVIRLYSGAGYDLKGLLEEHHLLLASLKSEDPEGIRHTFEESFRNRHIGFMSEAEPV
jgi:GntR family transcriptional regulator, transcriptional repressor for pyruvate dehydrogenase complex